MAENNNNENEKKSINNGLRGSIIIIPFILNASSNIFSDYVHDHSDQFSEKFQKILQHAVTALGIVIILALLVGCALLIRPLIDNIKKRNVVKSVLFSAVLAFVLVFTIILIADGVKGLKSDKSSTGTETAETTASVLQDDDQGSGNVSETPVQTTPSGTVLSSGEAVSGSFNESTDEYIYSFVLENVSDAELEFESDIETGWARPDLVLTSEDDQKIVAINEAKNEIYSLYTLNPGTYFVSIKRGSNEEESYGKFTVTINVSESDASENVGGTKTNFSDAFELVPNKDASNGIIHASRQENYYKFTLNEVSKVNIELYSEITAGWQRPDIELYDTDKKLIVGYKDVQNTALDAYTLDAGDYYILVKGAGDDPTSFGNYSIGVNAESSDQGPNVGGVKDNYSDAVVLDAEGESLNGIIHVSRQENYYKFSLNNVSKVYIDFYSEIAPGWQRPDVELYDTDKNLMARFKDAQNTALGGYILNEGEYYVIVKGSGDDPASLGNYSISVNAESSDQKPNVGGVKENYSDAALLEAGGESLNGILYYSRMKNYYYFELDKNASVSISFSSQISKGWQRPNINIIDGESKETVHTIKDIADGFTEDVSLSPGKYYVEVVTDGNSDSLEVFGNYEISLSVR